MGDLVPLEQKLPEKGADSKSIEDRLDGDLGDYLKLAQAGEKMWPELFNTFSTDNCFTEIKHYLNTAVDLEVITREYADDYLKSLNDFAAGVMYQNSQLGKGAPPMKFNDVPTFWHAFLKWKFA